MGISLSKADSRLDDHPMLWDQGINLSGVDHRSDSKKPPGKAAFLFVRCWAAESSPGETNFLA
jgi:hypothetical protein